MNIKNALLPLVLVSTLMHSFPSRAQEDHAIYGFYTDSCGQWLEARRAGGLEEIKYSIWVLGFVSGVGFAGYTLKESDRQGMTNWIDNYCEEHPLERFHEAAEALISAMQK